MSPHSMIAAAKERSDQRYKDTAQTHR